MAIEAHCGTLSALTLALPRSCAVPESRGTLPKGMFVAKVAVSAKTKQHLIHAIDGITMLAILRAANTGVEQGRRIPEVLVIGLRLADGIEEAPHDIVELIQAQRKSGIVFVCVRNVEFEGAMREEACFVVRRPLSERSGHAPTFHEFASAWIPSGEALLEIADAAEVSGHGLVFTWPADRKYLPAFAGIDHIVTSKDVTIGQVNSLTIPGSDHRALLATVDVSGLRH